MVEKVPFYKYAIKAVVGGIAAGLAALGTALIDNSVTATEWVGVASAAVVAFGAVYFAPKNVDL